MNDSFEQILDDLKRKTKENNLNITDVDNTLKSLSEFKLELESLLEYAIKCASGNDKEEFQKRYNKLTLQNQGEMVERLKNLGFSIRKRNDKNKNLIKALSLQAYRIMEKTRYGKRDEVYYMLARIFISNEEEFPFPLANAFNPNYSEEIFKIFIYSFLCGALGDSNEEEIEKT